MLDGAGQRAGRQRRLCHVVVVEVGEHGTCKLHRAITLYLGPAVGARTLLCDDCGCGARVAGKVIAAVCWSSTWPLN